jgi:hypothetical protein
MCDVIERRDNFVVASIRFVPQTSKFVCLSVGTLFVAEMVKKISQPIKDNLKIDEQHSVNIYCHLAYLDLSVCPWECFLWEEMMNNVSKPIKDNLKLDHLHFVSI